MALLHRTERARRLGAAASPAIPRNHRQLALGLNSGARRSIAAPPIPSPCVNGGSDRRQPNRPRNARARPQHRARDLRLWKAIIRATISRNLSAAMGLGTFTQMRPGNAPQSRAIRRPGTSLAPLGKLGRRAARLLNPARRAPLLQCVAIARIALIATRPRVQFSDSNRRQYGRPRLRTKGASVNARAAVFTPARGISPIPF